MLRGGAVRRGEGLRSLKPVAALPPSRAWPRRSAPRTTRTARCRRQSRAEESSSSNLRPWELALLVVQAAKFPAVVAALLFQVFFSCRPAPLFEARRGARAEQRAMATKTDLSRKQRGRTRGSEGSKGSSALEWKRGAWRGSSKGCSSGCPPVVG